MAALLLVGIVVPLLVCTYDQIEPRLFGFPFFYWYQLLWVFLAAGICGLCYFLLKRESDAYRRDHPRTPADGSRPMNINWVALIVLIVLFIGVTVMGFQAAKWRRPDDLASLHEWGLGGKSFGTITTWFLLGGDLYTAYTFVAVPAAMWATGAVSGFFAVPYTIVLYPIIFFFLGRMWSVAHRHGYVTTADFVQGRYGTRSLSLAVALTGILATMPYIALQLVGIQAVLEVVGLGGESLLAKDLPLLIAFAVLAAYTYSSGLRAPAMIAFVKDILIYIVIAVAVIYLPLKFGGWLGHLRRRPGQDGRSVGGQPQRADRVVHPRARCSTGRTRRWPWARRWRCSCIRTASRPRSAPRTAAPADATRPSCRPTRCCSACWPCSATSRSRRGRIPMGLDGKVNPQLVIPQLFEDHFPSWFTGVAFGAIAIGALVPAAIMSIAAANLFTRNIYKAYLKPERHRRPGGQGLQDRLADHQARGSAVRAAAGQAERPELPAARRGVDPADPALDRVRAVHPLVPPLGAAGRLGGRDDLRHGHRVRRVHRLHGATVRQLPRRGARLERAGYIGLTALVINFVVLVVLTVVFRALKVNNGTDITTQFDYFADIGDPRVQAVVTEERPIHP